MTHDGNGSEPELSGSSPMSGTREPDELAGLAEKQQVAGRHHAALDSLRPYFVARDLDPAGASAFVRLSLDVSRVLCEMGLAETAAGLWSVILPGLAGGKPIDRARWVLLGAEACAASNEGGCTVTRLADTVERDALDTPAGPAQRFLRAAAGLAQAAIDGWRHDRGALEILTGALALAQADAQLAPLGFRALLMLVDEAITQDRLGLARRALAAASDRFAGATRQVSFLEAEWSRRLATVLALEGRVDDAVTEFRRGIALCERQGWYAGFAYVELLVGLGALYAQTGQKQRAGRAYDDALRALVVGRRQQGAAFDEICVRVERLAAEGAMHAHPALIARASQLRRSRTQYAEEERQRRADMDSGNITDILRRVREFDPTPGMRIVMAEDALLEARSHTRVAFLAEDCAPWEMVPPTWYANPSYTRCPIGAEPDEDPDSTESWVRQLASQPVDDTAANELLDQALAGIDAKALSPQDEEAAEVARQVMEALTRCGYFWCASSSDDGRPTCSWGHRGQRTPHKTWARETRLQDPHPQARRSSKSEVRIEVAPDGRSDFWAAVVRYGRGYGWPSISIRVTPRWLALKARGLEVVDGQLVLELIEDGPEPLVRAAPAETEHGYGSGKPTLARVTHDGHLAWQEPL